MLPVLPKMTTAVFVMLVIAGCNSSKRMERAIEDAQAALGQGNHAEAGQLAAKALAIDPKNGAALLVAGQAAEGQTQWSQALEYYDRVAADQVAYKIDAYCRSAPIFARQLNQLGNAERAFRAALALDPNCVAAHDGLTYLLSTSGRRWEAVPHFLALIRLRQGKPGHLHGLGVLEQLLADPKQLEQCHADAPDDPLPCLGLARLALADQQWNEAQQWLSKAIQLEPTLIEAQARWGQLLLERDTIAELADWHRQLPPGSDTHPAIWVVRGRWCERTENRESAIRCYLEALRRNANDAFAASRVTILLDQTGHTEHAAWFARRAEQLMMFHAQLAQLQRTPDDPALLESVAQLAEQMGRLWEAYGWYEQILDRQPYRQSLQQHSDDLRQQLSGGTPQTVPEHNLAAQLVLDQWPLPQWSESSSDDVGQFAVTADATIRFREQAAELGLSFEYFNGHDSRRPGPYIYEVDGGGVGVLDYDRDGWPDLYFTQGSEWPPHPAQLRYGDRLFRNRTGTGFVDVSDAAGIWEPGFSQGLAVGDYDNDGFADVFVANIGGNRLFHNCGDGTFEDVTSASGLAGLATAVWTSSAAIADLNSDGLPDIYEVNYLRGDIHDLERVCPDASGTPRICPPLYFDAEQDRLYLNQGDGSFRDVAQAAGILAPGNGKGLGIVIGDFDDSGRNAIFVANDVAQNFFFYNETTEPGGPPQFVERALLMGLALSGEGKGQACMGVAADDLNLDGRLDLFVTNFYQEPNCLYMQQDGGYFVDATARAGLRDPSFLMLGFGTQSLDADLDGWPDLVVANGHLVDERDLGVPFRMRPQFFRNIGGGRFTELPADPLGEFFAQEQLGRSLARLDWNRDGKEDFAVSHLDTPAALITNVSEQVGHYVAIQLTGIDADRDAIGAKVTVEINGRQIRKQRTAGDGYQVTNQSQLVFGLGDAEQVDRLTIAWPSGRVQSWQRLPVDRQWMAVEGRSDLVAQ